MADVSTVFERLEWVTLENREMTVTLEKGQQIEFPTQLKQ